MLWYLTYEDAEDNIFFNTAFKFLVIILKFLPGIFAEIQIDTHQNHIKINIMSIGK